MKHWKTYLNWAGWGINIASLVYLIYRLAHYDHYGELGLSLSQADAAAWYALAIAFVLIPIQLLIEARRWQWVLRGWKDVSLKDSWHQVLVGAIAGFITPYRAGDLPARLVAAGIPMNKEQFKQQVRQWLKDWHKWLPVAGWTVMRYAVWGLQLWAVMRFVGIDLNIEQAICSIGMYYFLISFMPSLPAADIAIKGGWAVLIFGEFTNNVAAITLAVSIIWLFNTVMPILLAYINKMLRVCRNQQSH